jgi:hypothetical protein
MNAVKMVIAVWLFLGADGVYGMLRKIRSLGNSRRHETPDE